MSMIRIKDWINENILYVSSEKMNDKSLTTLEFFNSISIFDNIYDKLLKNYESNNKLSKITEWINVNILSISPVTFISINEIFIYTNSIFSDEDIRDFIFDLTFLYFASCSESDDFLNKLCVSIRNGVYITGNKLSSIPEDVSKTLINHTLNNIEFGVGNYKGTFTDILKNNKHLIIFYLIWINTVISKTTDDKQYEKK